MITHNEAQKRRKNVQAERASSLSLSFLPGNPPRNLHAGCAIISKDKSRFQPRIWVDLRTLLSTRIACVLVRGQRRSHNWGEFCVFSGRRRQRRPRTCEFSLTIVSCASFLFHMMDASVGSASICGQCTFSRFEIHPFFLACSASGALPRKKMETSETEGGQNLLLLPVRIRTRAPDLFTGWLKSPGAWQENPALPDVLEGAP